MVDHFPHCPTAVAVAPAERDRRTQSNETCDLRVVDRLLQSQQQIVTTDLRLIERLLVHLVYTHGLAHAHLTALAPCFVDLAAYLVDYLLRERQVLLSAPLRDEATASNALASHLPRELQLGRERVDGIFQRMRQVAADFLAPAGACSDYHHLLQKLSNLQTTWIGHSELGTTLLNTFLGPCRPYPPSRNR